MGRPIQRKWFGDPVNLGSQLKLTAWVPGQGSAGTEDAGFIIEQLGASRYKVDDGAGNIGDVKLVNTVTPGNLSEGEAFMKVVPFGGSLSSVSKLQQYVVNIYDTLDSATSSWSQYKWDAKAAEAANEADVIEADEQLLVNCTATITIIATDLSDAVITITETGSGYTGIPTVTASGIGGSGGETFLATISNGSVDTIVENGTPTGSYTPGTFDLTVQASPA